MADLTITITVAGTVSGQSFSWSRTATITDIEAAVFNVTEAAGAEFGIGSTEAATLTADGVHSYTGTAVSIICHNSPGAVAKVSALDGSGTATFVPLAVAGLPMIFYNGAGTGFTGGIKTGTSATDTPTVDIAGFYVTNFIGQASYSALLALKAVS